MRFPPSCATNSISCLARSIPLARRESSSTIHSGNPIALSTVSPESLIRFFKSFSAPPFLR